MGLFRRKEKKAEPVEHTPSVAAPASTSWREWEGAGRKLLSRGEVVDAVEYLVMAVHYFDSNDKELERFVRRIADETVDLAIRIAPKQKAVPSHILADIDREIQSTHPGFDSDIRLTDLIMDGIDSRLSVCEAPGDVVMMVTASVYASVGYMRYSADVREDMIRCARSSEICFQAAERAENMGKVKNQLLPKDAARFLRAYGAFSDTVKASLCRATADMSDGDLDLLCNYHLKHPSDFLDPLVGSVEAANRSVGSLSSKDKFVAKSQEYADAFADSKCSLDG